jgi:hypothetical protein
VLDLRVGTPGNRGEIQACYNKTVMEPHMGTLSTEPRPKPSPRYLRQIWLQIYLPMFVGLLVLIGIAILLSRGGVGTAGAWADASTVFLLIPVILVGFLFTLVLIAFAVGVGYLIGWLPGPIRKGWEILIRVRSGVRRGTDMAARPIVSVRGVWASLRAGVNSVTSIFRAE